MYLGPFNWSMIFLGEIYNGEIIHASYLEEFNSKLENMDYGTH